MEIRTSDLRFIRRDFSRLSYFLKTTIMLLNKCESGSNRTSLKRCPCTNGTSKYDNERKVVQGDDERSSIYNVGEVG
jgi:hypothetical protein